MGRPATADEIHEVYQATKRLKGVVNKVDSSVQSLNKSLRDLSIVLKKFNTAMSKLNEN